MKPDETATELLLRKGADTIDHPGGTLLAHLRRVHDLLDDWGARPALRLAGLCHAFYGTDGFAVALARPDQREELRTAIGPDAEDLVHFYASCDRARSHPGLHRPDGLFTDRFTGTSFPPTPEQRRDFAELTVANEVDVVRHARLDEALVAEMFAQFTTWEPLLGPAARQALRNARG